MSGEVFLIEGNQYMVPRRMDAVTQWDVLALVSPLLASGIVAVAVFAQKLKVDGVAGIAAAEAQTDQLSASATGKIKAGAINSVLNMPAERIAEMAPGVAREFAKMPTEARRELMEIIMRHVVRRAKDTDPWVPVWNEAARRPQFEDVNSDITLVTRIAWHVIMETFGRFFPASLTELIGGALR